MIHFTRQSITNTITDENNSPLNAWTYDFYWLIATEDTIQHRSHFTNLSIYLSANLSTEEVATALQDDALAQLTARQAGIMYEAVFVTE